MTSPTTIPLTFGSLSWQRKLFCPCLQGRNLSNYLEYLRPKLLPHRLSFDRDSNFSTQAAQSERPSHPAMVDICRKPCKDTMTSNADETRRYSRCNKTLQMWHTKDRCRNLAKIQINFSPHPRVQQYPTVRYFPSYWQLPTRYVEE